MATSTSTDPVQAAQHQAVRRVVDQLQPAVPVHRLGDVDQQRVRHRVARVLEQRVDHALGVVAGGAGVPQPERGQPVGVHVLGRALQLGERRDRHPAGLRVRVVDLEQQGLVGLHDQWSAGHEVPFDERSRPSSLPRRHCEKLDRRCTAALTTYGADRARDSGARGPGYGHSSGTAAVIRCSANVCSVSVRSSSARR